MSFKDPAQQSKFQNDWMKARRKEWIEKTGPCKHCKATELLRVVKNDPSVKTVKVFSYSEEFRNEVLSKCIVLCRKCATTHYGKIFRDKYTGRKGKAEVLTAELVWSIRGRLLGRETMRAIARSYGINHSTVQEIQKGKVWGWLQGGRRKVYGIRKHEEDPKTSHKGNTSV